MYNRSKLWSENTIFCFLDLFGLMEIWNAKVAFLTTAGEEPQLPLLCLCLILIVKTAALFRCCLAR